MHRFLCLLIVVVLQSSELRGVETSAPEMSDGLARRIVNDIEAEAFSVRALSSSRAPLKPYGFAPLMSRKELLLIRLSETNFELKGARWLPNDYLESVVQTLEKVDPQILIGLRSSVLRHLLVLPLRSAFLWSFSYRLGVQLFNRHPELFQSTAAISWTDYWFTDSVQRWFFQTTALTTGWYSLVLSFNGTSWLFGDLRPFAQLCVMVCVLLFSSIHSIFNFGMVYTLISQRIPSFGRSYLFDATKSWSLHRWKDALGPQTQLPYLWAAMLQTPNEVRAKMVRSEIVREEVQRLSRAFLKDKTFSDEEHRVVAEQKTWPNQQVLIPLVYLTLVATLFLGHQKLIFEALLSIGLIMLVTLTRLGIISQGRRLSMKIQLSSFLRNCPDLLKRYLRATGAAVLWMLYELKVLLGVILFIILLTPQSSRSYQLLNPFSIPPLGSMVSDGWKFAKENWSDNSSWQNRRSTGGPRGFGGLSGSLTGWVRSARNSIEGVFLIDKSKPTVTLEMLKNAVTVVAPPTHLYVPKPRDWHYPLPPSHILSPYTYHREEIALDNGSALNSRFLLSKHVENGRSLNNQTLYKLPPNRLPGYVYVDFVIPPHIDLDKIKSIDVQIGEARWLAADVPFSGLFSLMNHFDRVPTVAEVSFSGVIPGWQHFPVKPHSRITIPFPNSPTSAERRISLIFRSVRNSLRTHYSFTPDPSSMFIRITTVDETKPAQPLSPPKSTPPKPQVIGRAA